MIEPAFSGDLYGRNIFAHDPHRDGPQARRARSVDVPVQIGMVLEDAATGWVGEVLRVEKSGGMIVMELEDRRGRRKTFPLGPGFWLEGRPVNLLPPRVEQSPHAGRASQTRTPRGQASTMTTPGGRKITNSGSIAVPRSAAKVARASRLWVEGRHDADLIQHVWGDDLAEAGVVVELLEGVDHLEKILVAFDPNDQERAGVLVDHMVEGSKEWRIAQQSMAQWERGLLIVGHPFVDIWQAVKSERLGLQQWPHIPRGTDIKVGTLKHLGWPHTTQIDIALGWRRILSTVRSYRDLEPALLGRVEELIDFVTAPGTQ